MHAAVSKLTVEVLGADGGLYPGTVLDLNKETRVIYLKFEENWMQEGWYPLTGNTLFEPPAQQSSEAVQQHLILNGPVEVFYRVKQGAPAAWYRGKLVSEAKGLYTIDLPFNPVRRVNHPIDHVRLAREPMHLTVDSILPLVHPIPESAVKEATNDRQLQMFAQHAKIEYVRYDPIQRAIIVLVFGQAAYHRASILIEMHVRYAMQRQTIRDEIANMRMDLYGPEGSETGTGSIRCEFFVPLNQIGRSVGRDFANLKRARALPGIFRIIMDKTNGNFLIIAQSEIAMKEAREILEFVTEIIYIDQPFVGHIIGYQGKNVADILEKSNVATLNVCDDPARAEAIGVPEWRAGFVPLVLTGLRAETELAKMIVEYQLDHNRKLEAELGPRRKPVDQVKRRESNRQLTEDSEHADTNEKLNEERRQETGNRRPESRRNTDQIRAPESQHDNGRRSSAEWPVVGQTDRRTSTPTANGVVGSSQEQHHRRASGPKDSKENSQRHEDGNRNNQENNGRGRGSGSNFAGHRNNENRHVNTRLSEKTNDKFHMTNGEANARRGHIDAEGYQSVGRKRGRGARGHAGPGNGHREVAVESHESERVSR